MAHPGMPHSWHLVQVCKLQGVTAQLPDAIPPSRYSTVAHTPSLPQALDTASEAGLLVTCPVDVLDASQEEQVILPNPGAC